MARKRNRGRISVYDTAWQLQNVRNWKAKRTLRFGCVQVILEWSSSTTIGPYEMWIFNIFTGKKISNWIYDLNDFLKSGDHTTFQNSTTPRVFENHLSHLFRKNKTKLIKLKSLTVSFFRRKYWKIDIF